MKRRGFLKMLFGGLVSAPIVVLVKDFKFPKIKKVSGQPVITGKKLPKPGTTPEQKFFEAFKAELKKYPRGHVARSIAKIELLYNPNDFKRMIRGISVGSKPKDAKYYAFNITSDEKMLLSKKYLKNVTRDMLETIRLGWKHSHRMWGVA